MMGRLVKYLFYGFGVALVLALSIVAYWLFPVMDDPTQDYREADTSLAQTVMERDWRARNSRYTQLTLYSHSGIRVPITVRMPLQGRADRPVMILLGGQRTGRDACALIKIDLELNCIALSYPYEGDADLHGLNALWNVREVQRAILHTPPAVMLALNYVAQHPELRDAPVELVGVSLGAFLVSVPAALDQRVQRVWLIHGAAEPATVLSHQLRNDIGNPRLRRWLGNALSVLIGGPYLKPERWIGRVSPRPVVMINARDDEALPPATIQRLHAAAAHPKEIIWTEGGHVLPGREEIISQLTRLVFQRIQNKGSR